MIKLEGKPNIEAIKRIALQILKELQEKGELNNGYIRGN